MSTYEEAIWHTQNEIESEAKRDRVTHEAVLAALHILDTEYPEFRKSDGPFGDRLAGQIHRVVEAAFNEVRQQEEAELTSLEALKGKYRGVQFYG